MRSLSFVLFTLLNLGGLVKATSPEPFELPEDLAKHLLYPRDETEKYKTETFVPSETPTVTSLSFYNIPTATPVPSNTKIGQWKPRNNGTYAKPGFNFHHPTEGQHFGGRGKKFNFTDYMDREKARLRPALDVRVDANEVENIRPKRNYSMPYISRDFQKKGQTKKHAVMAADLRFKFKKDTVMLEHFMNLIDDLECNSKESVMTLSFSSSRALSLVQRFWPDIHAENGFRLVSPLSGPECVVDDQRGVYKARVIEIDESAKKVYLNYTVADWQQVSETINIQFGEIELENEVDAGDEPGEKLRRRTDELRKRWLFNKIKNAIKKVVNKVVDVVKGVVEKIVDVVKELTTAKFNPSVSFSVGVGPWINDESPFGPALKIFDSSNGGWPKDLNWKELNNIIVTTKVQRKLKKRGLDRENLSFEEFMLATVEAEYEATRARVKRGRVEALERRADLDWINFSAWCVNCFVKANLAFSGGLQYFVLGLKLEELYVQFDGSLEQNFQLGMILKGNKEWTHSKEIVRVPIGPGIVIPGVFSLGCTLPVTVGVSMNTDVSFVTLMGVNFKWGAMHAKIDIKNGKGTSSGWDPVTTWTKPDLKGLAISADAELSATVAFEVGVTVLGDVFQENAGISGTVGIGEKLTYNRPELNSCTGLGLVTHLRVGIDAYVQRIKTWRLFERMWTIGNVCLWERNQARDSLPLAPPVFTASLQPSLTTVTSKALATSLP